MARDKKNSNDSTNSTDSGAGGVASPVWWGAAAVLVLVLLGLVWVLVGGNSSTPAAGPTRTVTASPTPSVPGSELPPAATPNKAAAAGCNVPGANSTVPTAAISVTWQAVGGIVVPVSPSVGPKVITGKGNTLRSCYQQSPAGAVLAAMNIAGAGTTSNAHQVIREGFTPGPGREEAQQQPADAGGGSIAGFQAQACTQRACLVKILFAVQGVFVEQTMPMIWVGNDWKVDGQVTGVAKGVRVGGLVGYTPMSPVSGGS